MNYKHCTQSTSTYLFMHYIHIHICIVCVIYFIISIYLFIFFFSIKISCLHFDAFFPLILFVFNAVALKCMFKYTLQSFKKNILNLWSSINWICRVYLLFNSNDSFAPIIFRICFLLCQHHQVYLRCVCTLYAERSTRCKWI